MDKIELNGEIYVKESTINNLDDDIVIKILKESSINIYDIAEILKDKLGKELDTTYIHKDDIDNNNINVRNILLYSALCNYC